MKFNNDYKIFKYNQMKYENRLKIKNQKLVI